jgi:hypothetical protein
VNRAVSLAQYSEDPPVGEEASSSAAIARLAVEENLVPPRFDSRYAEPERPEGDWEYRSAQSAESDPRRTRGRADRVRRASSVAVTRIGLRRKPRRNHQHGHPARGAARNELTRLACRGAEPRRANVSVCRRTEHTEECAGQKENPPHAPYTGVATHDVRRGRGPQQRRFSYYVG